MKKSILLLSMFFAFGFCSSSNVENQITIKILELNIHSRFMRKNKDVIIYEPNSHVKKEHYTRYTFDAKKFENIFPDWKSKSRYRIKVGIFSTKKNVKKSTNALVSSPHGGFRFTTHRSLLLSVLTSK